MDLKNRQRSCFLASHLFDNLPEGRLDVVLVGHVLHVWDRRDLWNTRGTFPVEISVHAGFGGWVGNTIVLYPHVLHWNCSTQDLDWNEPGGPELWQGWLRVTPLLYCRVNMYGTCLTRLRTTVETVLDTIRGDRPLNRPLFPSTRTICLAANRKTQTSGHLFSFL